MFVKGITEFTTIQEFELQNYSVMSVVLSLALCTILTMQEKQFRMKGQLQVLIKGEAPLKNIRSMSRSYRGNGGHRTIGR